MGLVSGLEVIPVISFSWEEQRHVQREAQVEPEMGAGLPRFGQCQGPPEAGKGKEGVFPGVFGGTRQVHTLTWISGL